MVVDCWLVGWTKYRAHILLLTHSTPLLLNACWSDPYLTWLNLFDQYTLFCTDASTSNQMSTGHLTASCSVKFLVSLIAICIAQVPWQVNQAVSLYGHGGLDMAMQIANPEAALVCGWQVPRRKLYHALLSQVHVLGTAGVQLGRFTFSATTVSHVSCK